MQIVESGSFAAAATRLHITQSSVSARIKELESYFGVPLFTRQRPQKAELTAKGEALLQGARELIAFSQQLRLRVSDDVLSGGVIRLGVVGHLANTNLAQAIVTMRQSYPSLMLDIHVDLSRALLELVDAGKLDAAIVAGNYADDSMVYRDVFSDEFVWMVAGGKDLPNGSLTPEMLARWPILSFNDKSYHYPAIRRWFSDAGVPFVASLTTNNMNLLADLVAAGEGVALLPVSRYKNRLLNGDLKVLPATPSLPPVKFSLAHRVEADKVVTWLAQRFAQTYADLLNH